MLLIIAAVGGAVACGYASRCSSPTSWSVSSSAGGAGIVSAHDQIDLLAQMASRSCCSWWPEADLAHVRHIGPVALATDSAIGFTIAVGFALVLLLGRPAEALYVAVALTFSSTIIIVKLLSDKREIDALHGRIAVAS